MRLVYSLLIWNIWLYWWFWPKLCFWSWLLWNRLLVLLLELLSPLYHNHILASLKRFILWHHHWLSSSIKNKQTCAHDNYNWDPYILCLFCHNNYCQQVFLELLDLIRSKISSLIESEKNKFSTVKLLYFDGKHFSFLQFQRHWLHSDAHPIFKHLIFSISFISIYMCQHFTLRWVKQNISVIRSRRDQVYPFIIVLECFK